MNDQELMTDLLLTEKKMSANYGLFASECVNTKLRDAFVDLLTQGHKTQTQLFQAAQQRGWYQVEQAPAQKVAQAEQKFTNQTPTME
ncbi:MAG TPA: spore coat protein [Candidatus Enterenecus stercoripullorum]|nr:spore coat protein [Candidatus Enterenecus stercoripullorum]